MPNALSPWQRRDNFSLDRHQQLVGAINELSAITPTGDIDVVRTPMGSGVIDKRQPVAGDQTILVKITSAATGAGKYNGRSVIAPYGADVDPTTALISSDLGTFASADDCLVLNMTEIGTSSHNLTNAANTNQFYFFGRLLKTNSDGIKVVAINGFWAKACAT